MRFNFKAYQSEAILLFFIGTCAFVYTALFSFNPYDPSYISASFPETKVLNLCGVWGAHVSAFFITQLGMFSYLLPITLIYVYSVLLSKRATFEKSLIATGALSQFLALMCLISVIFPTVTLSGIPFATAGSIGNSIYSITRHHLGEVGSLIILICLSCASGLLMAQKSFLKHFLHNLRRKFIAVFDYFKNSKFPRLSRKDKVAVAKPEIKRSAAVSQVQPSLFADEEDNDNTEYDSDEDESPLDSAADDDNESDEEDCDVPESPRQMRVYKSPSLSIFKHSGATAPLSVAQKREFENTAKTLTTAFEDFGIIGQVVAIQPGPVVTVFEFQPDAGTKLAKINSLVDDIALALKVDSIIMHPVRGKRAVGIQVPNSHREMVRLGDLLQSDAYRQSSSPLTVALGKAIDGEPVCADLTKMPHLLTAGATGSGKSVAINGLLCSILMKATPQKVRMILVDPKMLELSIYEGIPHLLMPVITEPQRASIALKWATQEMERRYKLMQHAKVRNIVGYNEFYRNSTKADRQQLEMQSGETVTELPFILIVIDELADLMMTAPKEVEGLIQRLAQKARASGIHLVLATQRPSVDIITGVIKANLPCRAAFQVVSKHDSRTILDQNGADKLLGNGDMLFQRPGSNRLERIQSAFISDDEVIHLVETIKEDNQMDYDRSVIEWIDEEIKRSSESLGKSFDKANGDEDERWDEAVSIASSQGAISASYLQRQLKIGYNRAARIVETMEAQGLVAKADGVKPRKWIGPQA